MSVQILIHGTDQVAAGRIENEASATFTLQRGQRGTATITLIIKPGDTYATTVGWLVVVKEITPGPTTTIVFQGTIDQREIKWEEKTGTHHEILTVVSLEQTFDVLRVTPPKAYFNKTCAFIVNDLLSTVYSGGVVTAGTISTGATIDVLVLDGDTLSDVFTNLATQCGFIWWVDPATAQLNFCVMTTVAAPFTLSDSDVLFFTLDYQQQRSNYRNQQSVRVNFSSFYDSNEVFGGGGGTTFTLRNPVSRVTAAVLFKAPLSAVVQSEATLTFSGQPSAGDTVTVNDAPYIFKSSIDNTQLVEVLIGANLTATIQNLCDCINGKDSTRGTAYSMPTWENDACNAVNPTATTLKLQVKWPGSGGNGHVVTTTSGVITITDAYGNTTTTTEDAVDGLIQSLSVSSAAAIGGQQSLSYTTGSADVTTSVSVPVGTRLSVQYQRLGGDVITVQDTAAVAARAAIEGGKGLYAQETQDTSNTSARSGLLEAQTLLAAFGVVPSQLQFTTFKPGLSPGRYLAVSLTVPTGGTTLVNGNWVIQEVVATLIPGSLKSSDANFQHFQYEVTAIDQAQVQTWERTFAAMSAAGAGGGSNGGGGRSGLTRQPPSPTQPGFLANSRAKLPGTLTVASNVLATPYVVLLPPNTTENIGSVTVTAQVAPSTTDLIIDVLVSTDDGATWNSIFQPGAGNQITLTTGSFTVTVTPGATSTYTRGFVIPTLHSGDQVQISILQCDTTVSGVEVAVSGSLVIA